MLIQDPKLLEGHRAVGVQPFRHSGGRSRARFAFLDG